ncbi:MAG: type II secretion system protein [Candidatus Omnitrophota bacterium]
MNNKAKSFVTIMVVIAISALLLRIAIDKVMKLTLAQNESGAAASLKLISTALQNYASDHNGFFPANFSELIQAVPAYLDKDYLNFSPIKGYQYVCPRLEGDGYTCRALPVKCGLTGSLIYTVTTGGLMVSEECKIKE